MLDLNITDVILSLTNTLIHFQTQDGYWTKQRLLPELPVEHITTLTHTFPSISTKSKFPQLYLIMLFLLIPLKFKNFKYRIA